jgi:KDO2-lipid IV(A) lauroyltransferase
MNGKKLNKINYFLQFVFISSLFAIFKLIGLKYSLKLSSNIAKLIGPIFRSNKICFSNLDHAFPNLDNKEKEILIKKMWMNYGKILSEYIFLKFYRQNKDFHKNIEIKNETILYDIRKKKKSVIFVSGHFNNFELMAMKIEMSGIPLAAIYRPLNNYFLNPIMEKIRKKYLCKHQIKKGISGTKELLKCFKKNISIALMIDQRVSEGIKCDFFGKKALTSTIPAQFVKKFGAEIVPVYIERNKHNKFIIQFSKPIKFKKEESVYDITLELNKILEKMILKNPDQWIWTHNRWK